MKQRKTTPATLTAVTASSMALLGSPIEEVVSPWTLSHVRMVTSDYFASHVEHVRIKPLAGGYSDAANLLLAIDGKMHVLRVLNASESSLKRNTEVYAMKVSAAIGIAPAVHWTSPDGYGILMDYIAGGTLSIEQAKKPEIISKVADMLRQVHALPKNPFYAPSFESVMEEFYQHYAQGDRNQTIWEEAIAIIKEGASQLHSLNAPTVNTHGDLNPRNILVSDQDLYFIDWGDGLYTDPFQDVAFFSIMMDYDLQEEAYLMERYLGHTPTANESKRFRIAKKMNFARLVLSGQGIGNELSLEQNDTDRNFALPREWSYYAHTFANTHSPLSAQFFWGQAQVALASAKALDINDIES